MAVDLEYFRRCRDTDPSYTVRDAIVEYLSGDFDEAVWLANEICELNDDYDRRLLTDDDVYEFIRNMDPLEAYQEGCCSGDIKSGTYYRIDGYGHFEEVDWDHVECILYDGWRRIVNEECDIPDDLQDIIDLFREDDDEDDEDDDDVSSMSIKRGSSKGKASVKKPATKSNCAKKPAKSQCVKSSGTSKGKASVKKSASKPKQSNNRKPRTTSGKKPAPRRR